MAAVTLVVGDEEFLVARAVRRAVDGIAQEREEPPDVHDVMAADLDLDALAEMTSPSLFGDVPLIVVRALQDAPKDVAAALVELVSTREDLAGVLVHAGSTKGMAASAMIAALPGTGRRASAKANGTDMNVVVIVAVTPMVRVLTTAPR